MATIARELEAGTAGEAVRPAGGGMEVIRRAREQGVRIVDVEFTDLLGTWQH